MYSISNIIVGVPLTKELSRLVGTWESEGDDRWQEWEDLGFETFYHGGAGQSMGFCGVKIGQFDECADYIKVNPDGVLDYVGYRPHKVNLVPTKEQIEEAQAKVNALSPELRELCPEFGVYIVQSTS